MSELAGVSVFIGLCGGWMCVFMVGVGYVLVMTGCWGF